MTVTNSVFIGHCDFGLFYHVFDCIVLYCIACRSSQMSGPEATRAIRELYGSSIIVIGLTGNVMPEDVKHFTDHGADAVLHKPLDINKFLGLLERIHIEKKA
jgi:CheY-like chemotaxis protein